MPPKRKKRSKSMPKQSQSQRQSVVVNIGTSKTKSKPRKSRGRGGLPPPSYQHNLAPTFVTQQATDYNPVIGAIASLTSRLQQEPRIQNPVTPLSSTVQATSQSAQQAQAMAGEAAIGRAGKTADSFVPHASQVRTATVDYVMPRESIGTNRPTRVVRELENQMNILESNWLNLQTIFNVFRAIKGHQKSLIHRLSRRLIVKEQQQVAAALQKYLNHHPKREQDHNNKLKKENKTGFNPRKIERANRLLLKKGNS